MGTQQLLLLVLGTIIVAIAIAVGITEFRAYNTESMGDEIQQTLTSIAAEAKAFYMKPKTLGGGGGTFAGFSLPKGLNSGGLRYGMPSRSGDSFMVIQGFAPDGDIWAVLGTTPDKGFTLLWQGHGAYADRSAPSISF